MKPTCIVPIATEAYKLNVGDTVQMSLGIGVINKITPYDYGKTMIQIITQNDYIADFLLTPTEEIMVFIPCEYWDWDLHATYTEHKNH